VKPEFWTQGSNSWDSICQVWPLALKCQIKKHGEGRERRFITQLWTCHGKRQNEHSAIFSHLWGTDMSYRFK
jgi:hypothetical protein